MRKRLKRLRYEALALIPKLRLTPALALRSALREGYGRRHFVSDLMAGLVVGVVALPLAMALAIASGVPPQHGLYTAIVAGFLIAALGGSRTQVSGPTAAFVVILAPISAKYGVQGLLLATMMAGAILVVMGAARLGRLIEFIPHPVTTGFTAGIAVVIATLQVKDFLGLSLASNPSHFLDKVGAIGHALPTTRLPDVIIGAGTLVMLLVWPRVTRRIPAPLVAIVLGTAAAYLLARFADFHALTIGDNFKYEAGGKLHPGIPQTPPLPLLPWNLPGPPLSFELLRNLFPSAFAIAMLGAIESLLCAVVSDGMAGTKHDPDTELVAQGVGNVVAPFFGGIAATGAIARTATNVRAGARSPIAAMIHALFVLAAVLALAPLVAYLPMASLAALLLIVAWNMSEVKHFSHIVRVAPKSDVAILLACFALTVIFDMVVSVTAGIMLAALLFMRRMSEITTTKLHEGETPHLAEPLPRGVLVYEIAGPFFFGSTSKAMSTLESIAGGRKTVILHMGSVPAMDVTGLVALESAIERLRKAHDFVIIAGVQPQPAEVLRKGNLRDAVICPTLAEAVAFARSRRSSAGQAAVT